MAQVTKKTKKDGTTSYLIRAYSGRTQAGKVITKCRTVTPPAGLTVRKTERWVQEQADQFEKEVRNGLVLDSEMLLDDLIDRWFTEYAEKQLKAKTLYDYKKMRTRITAGLGHLKVCDIKPAHLMAFYNNLEEQGVRQDSTFTATPALLKLLPRGERGAMAQKAQIGQDTMRLVYQGRGSVRRRQKRYPLRQGWRALKLLQSIGRKMVSSVETASCITMPCCPVCSRRAFNGV